MIIYSIYTDVYISMSYIRNINCGHETRPFFSRLQVGSDLETFVSPVKKGDPLSPTVKTSPHGRGQKFLTFHKPSLPWTEGEQIPHGRGCNQARKKLSARSSVLPRAVW